MRTYVDHGEVLTWGNMTIPKNSKNVEYVEALALVSTNEAEIVPYVKPALTNVDKAEAKLIIDTAAEQCRLQWVTTGAGQALVYQEKRSESERWYATGGVGDYPIMEASVGIEAANLSGVAALVQATLGAWTMVAADIERLRLQAKKRVTEATTWEDIATATNVSWPTP